MRVQCFLGAEGLPRSGSQKTEKAKRSLRVGFGTQHGLSSELEHARLGAQLQEKTKRNCKCTSAGATSARTQTHKRVLPQFLVRVVRSLLRRGAGDDARMLSDGVLSILQRVRL